MPPHEVLGEGLRAFDTGGGLAGSKDAASHGLEAVRQPVDQRGFRADDGQGDVLGLGERHQLVELVTCDGDIFGLRQVRGAAVPRCHEKPGQMG